MIEFTSEIYQPRLSVDVGYQVSIKSFSESISDKSKFQMWLAKKVAENGIGEHSEVYIEKGEKIVVNFTVVNTEVSHATEFLNADYV